MRIADLLLRAAGRDAHDWQGYAVALLVTALAALAETALAPWLHPFTLVFYLPAVSLVAFVAGTAPALLAAGLCGACLVYFVWPDHNAIAGFRAAIVIPFLAYTAAAGAQIAMIHALRGALGQARGRAAQADALLADERENFGLLQHRMANNMQVVASILTLQKLKVRSDPSLAERAFDDARERVVSMTRMHRRLYDPAALGKSVQYYLGQLCGDLAASAAPHHIVCTVSDDAEISDPSQLMALSLLIGEAVGNALKHAFSSDHAGTVSIDLKRAGARHILTIRDNGRGLPPGFEPGDSGDVGFRIMQALAAQIGGRLEVAPASEGTALSVVFAV